jgi:hypothetical protein
VEGLPVAAKPSLKVQLSSPIEELTLSAVNDKISFKGVETSVATLIVTAKDADIPLGSSSPHDVAPLCTIDPMNMKEKYDTELPVAIIGEGGSTATASVDAEAEKQDSTASVEAEAVAEVVPIQPVCTVTLKVSFTPSAKDQRDELYELLNKVSRRKATALENLRQVSIQAAKDRSAPDASSPSSGGGGGPVVKSGFLNAKSKKEESKWQKLYAKTIGPDSILRKSAMVVFAFKDYLVFFGAVGFMHFNGQMLALPPPV